MSFGSNIVLPAMRAVGKGPGGQCLGPSESHRSCEGPMRALGAAADGGLAGPLWKARGLGLVSLSVLHRGPEYTRRVVQIERFTGICRLL